MLRAYTYKLLHSPLFYISIIGIAGLCCTEFLFRDFGLGSVQYHVGVFLGLAKYRKSIAIFSAIPFAANFADEWTHGVAKDCIIRRGAKKYAAANLLFCWISAMVTVLLGMWLFMYFDSLFVPWSEVDPNPYSLIFEHFLNEGNGVMYLLCVTLVFSANCAMWASMGMLLSVFFPNKYVAICAPLVASYVVERVTMRASGWFHFRNLATSYIPASYFNGSDFLGLLYCVGLFATIAAGCGAIFYVFLKRKVQNELT